MTTAGNLVFVGKNDGEFVALNAKTGEELWHFQTGAGANAPATVFESEGEEKIAIVAGGNALAGSTHGSNLWVFSLGGKVDRLPGLEKAAKRSTTPVTTRKKNKNRGGRRRGRNRRKRARETGRGRCAERGEQAEEVFAENCSVCHGADRPAGNGGPDLTTMPKAKEQAGAEDQVTNGGGGMPGSTTR